MRYYLTINASDKDNTRFSAKIHRGQDIDLARCIDDCELGPGLSVAIKRETLTLRQITDAFSLFDPENDDEHAHIIEYLMDQAGQIQLGDLLFTQTFGRLSAAQRKAIFEQAGDAPDIRIVTDSPFIVSLPWVLMRRERVFLFLNDCSIALAQSSSLKATVAFPLLPKILIAAPSPESLADTEKAGHLDQLKAYFTAYNPLLAEKEYYREVSTWEDMCRELEFYNPDLFYYYGHGAGDRDSVCLRMEAPGSGEVDDRLVTDLMPLFHRIRKDQGEERLPKIAYFNCCKGNCGGLTGTGMQLEGIIPAIVTNRTTAWTKNAREQALVFWDFLLAGRRCPGSAITEVYGRTGGTGQSLGNIRWMCPVLHANYDAWNCKKEEKRTRAHSRFYYLNREQSDTIILRSGKMLENNAPRTYAFIWYGRPGQGMLAFHNKLELELKKLKSNTEYLSLSPQFPPEINSVDDPGVSFSAMITDCVYEEISKKKYLYREIGEKHAFTFAHIKHAIRLLTRGSSDKKTLLYIRHYIPASQLTLYNHTTIRKYLAWLHGSFIPNLEPSQFILLGVSLEVNKPEKFKDAVKNHVKPPGKNILIKLLEPFGNINEQHIEEFLDEFYPELSFEQKQKVIDKILKKTGGAYEHSVLELRNELDNKAASSGKKNDAGQDGDGIDYV